MATAPGARFAHFAALFRAELSRQVEFSLSPHAPHVYGTGLPGDGVEFWERVRRLAQGAPYAVEWAAAVERLRVRLRPSSFFFKVDWHGETAVRITLYFRFARALTDRELSDAFAHGAPLAWHGPSPCALARAVGEASPFIIGLRAAPDGPRVAMYYRVATSRAATLAHALPEVVRMLGLPAELPEEVRRTMRLVTGLGSPSILGIDSPDQHSAAALKIDVAGVLLRDALRFIVRQGAGDAQLRQIAAVARSVRVEVLSYCGAKFGPEGFGGWKLYLPVRPITRLPVAERVRIGDDGRQLRAVPW